MVAVLGAGLVLPALVSTPAMAMEVDNNTGQDATVWFSCGIGCGNYFKLSAGSSAARRDTEGTVELELDYDDGYNAECENREAKNGALAYVSAGGTIRASLSSDREKVIWKASQGNGVTMFWTFFMISGQDPSGPLSNGTFCWLGTA